MTARTKQRAAAGRPLAQFVARIRTRRERRVLREAMGRTHSPSDHLAYALDLALLAHPGRVSSDADYPDWTPGERGACRD